MLIEDLGELKPSIFCAVPRVLDRVYTGIFAPFYLLNLDLLYTFAYPNHLYVTGLQQKLSVGGFFKKKVFDVAFS